MSAPTFTIERGERGEWDVLDPQGQTIGVCATEMGAHKAVTMLEVTTGRRREHGDLDMRARAHCQVCGLELHWNTRYTIGKVRAATNKLCAPCYRRAMHDIGRIPE